MKNPTAFGKSVLMMVAGLFVAAALALAPVTLHAQDFDNVVLFATNSIRLGTDQFVKSGDVVVNDNDTANDNLELGFELFVDQHSRVNDDVRADRIKVVGTADFRGVVECTSAPDNPEISCTGFNSPVFEADELPIVVEAIFTGLEEDVTVAQQQTMILLAGEYKDITVGDNGKIVFTGGVYNIRSLIAGADVTLEFDAATQLRISGMFATGPRSSIKPAKKSPATPSTIVFHIGGSNSVADDPNSTPAAAAIGNLNAIQATFYVPNGTLRIGRDAAAKGAFLARDLWVDRNGLFNVEEFVVDLPPTADDQIVITDATIPPSVEITLTGSDPENDPLTFSISIEPTNGTLSVLTQVPPSSATVIYTANVGNVDSQDSFTFRVTDPNGGFDEAVVGIDIDELPTADPQTVFSDGLTLITLTGSDQGNQPLTFSIEVDPSPGDLTDPVQTSPSSATVTYTTSEPDPDSFTFRVTDANGGFDDAVVDIVRVRDTLFPIADPQTVLTNGTTPLVITLTGRDPDADPLTFSIVSGSGPSEGSLSTVTQLTPFYRATVTYTATLVGDLQDSFTFRVTDPSGRSGDAVVDINDTDPVDDPPNDPFLTNVVVGQDASVEAVDGTELVITLTALADIGTTMDLFDIGDFEFTILSGSSLGELSFLTPGVPPLPTCGPFNSPPCQDPVLTQPVTSATVVYLPLSSGPDSFDFMACADLNDDGDSVDDGECDTATISITVVAFTAAADPVAPAAQNLDVTVPEDASVTINLTSQSGAGSIFDPEVGAGDTTPGSGSHASSAAAEVVLGLPGAELGTDPNLDVQGFSAPTCVVAGEDNFGSKMSLTLTNNGGAR